MSSIGIRVSTIPSLTCPATLANEVIVNLSHLVRFIGLAIFAARPSFLSRVCSEGIGDLRHGKDGCVLTVDKVISKLHEPEPGRRIYTIKNSIGMVRIWAFGVIGLQKKISKQ